MESITVEKKILAFDFLRAIAIFVVILTHSTTYLSYKYIKYMIAIFNPFFAQIGLGLFIFISGYLIYYNNNCITSVKDVLFFYKKRVLRIFPLYWIALAVFTLTFSVYPHILSPQFIYPDASTLFSFHNLMIHILGMQILLSPIYSTPIFTLYFIGVIITFYLIYPILILFSKTTSHFLLISIFIFLSSALISSVFGIIDEAFFNFYPIFIAGILLSRTDILNKCTYNPYLAIAPIVFVLSLILQDRLFLYLDPRISITAISASSGTIDNSVAIIVLKEFAESLGMSYEFVKLTIRLLLFNISSIIFCVAQVWVVNTCINEKLSTSLSSIITYIATASYTVYLFHRPFLSIWASMINSIQISPFFRDSITIIIIIPLMFVILYHVQYVESLVRTRIIYKKNKVGD